VASSRINVAVDDTNDIQQRALRAGGVLIETIEDALGGGSVVEGPERLSLYIVSKAASASNQAHIFLSSLLPKNDKVDERPVASAAISNPRPLIHTLSVKILNIHSQDEFTTCPPNLRAPMPFETEIFKGNVFYMMLL
jgi:hypothetical protein